MRRRLLFVTALVTSLVAGAATTANRPAEAAFSGVNGKIVPGQEPQERSVPAAQWIPVGSMAVPACWLPHSNEPSKRSRAG